MNTNELPLSEHILNNLDSPSEYKFFLSEEDRKKLILQSRTALRLAEAWEWFNEQMNKGASVSTSTAGRGWFWVFKPAGKLYSHEGDTILEAVLAAKSNEQKGSEV